MAKLLTVSEFARLGGKTRAKKLSAEERSEAARKAVEARWKKSKESLDKTIASVEKLAAKPKRNTPKRSEHSR